MYNPWISHMQPYYYGFGTHPWWSFILQPLMPLLIALIIFDIVLRGLALWHAARHYQKYWFMALLIINSVGLLPIFYLAFFQKDRAQTPPNSPEPIRRTSRSSHA